MSLRIAFTVFVIVVLASASAVAACPNAPPKTHPTKPPAKGDNCLDLDAVPQISEHIVAGEPASPAKAPAYSEPAPTQYEGPTLNLTKPDPGVKPTPTIGYQWSLE